MVPFAPTQSVYFSPIFFSCAESWSLLRYVNWETLLAQRSKLRSDALPAITIDFFWDSNSQLAARKSCILTIKPRPLPYSVYIYGPLYDKTTSRAHNKLTIVVILFSCEIRASGG